MRRLAAWVAVWSVSSLACGGGEARALRLGATYTLEQSGALALLDSAWTAPRAVWVIAASGQILRSAAAGDLDVAITHAPSLERRLLATGRVRLVCPLFASRFAIVGPTDDPARVAAARSAPDALQRIAAARGGFVSRGDSSGTHTKELELWRRAGSGPPQRDHAYVESGTDQATALRVAAERQAYALADLPTWERVGPPGLRILFTDDTALANPYTLFAIHDTTFARHAITAWRNHVLAMRLADGTPAFTARPGGETCEAPV